MRGMVKKDLTRFGLLMMFVLMGIAFFVTNSYAFSTPAAGSFLYDAYDIAVNKMLKGPIGFIGGLGLIAYGGSRALSPQGGWQSGVLPILMGGCLIKLDTILTTLGFYV